MSKKYNSSASKRIYAYDTKTKTKKQQELERTFNALSKHGKALRRLFLQTIVSCNLG